MSVSVDVQGIADIEQALADFTKFGQRGLALSVVPRFAPNFTISMVFIYFIRIALSAIFKQYFFTNHFYFCGVI